MKTALVCGAGGFIGSHMVKRLKKEGYWVRGVDLKKPEYSQSEADHFVVGDLRNPEVVSRVTFAPNQSDIYNEHGSFDLVIQMAADMGGAGYIFTGDNDANVMHNSALVNLNMVYYCTKNKVKKILFSSSACAYPEHIQDREDIAALKESDCFPAAPDSPYGWEKIFSEILFDSFRRNYGLDVRICRFHNIFGPESCYNNGKEKAPAAVCYKVASAEEGGEVEIWGDGKQTRSFLFIDEAVEGVMRLLDGDYVHPVNIGSNEMIAINDLAKMVIDISGKNLTIKNVESNAIGVRGRNSDNTLIEEKLGWKPSRPLREGMEKLYNWINQKV
jgi:nucleoside-diphosphate-sugar epimerase